MLKGTENDCEFCVGIFVEVMKILHQIFIYWFMHSSLLLLHCESISQFSNENLDQYL